MAAHRTIARRDQVETRSLYLRLPASVGFITRARLAQCGRGGQVEITTMMIGFAALGAVATIAIVLAWPRRRLPRATRLVERSRLKSRSGWRSRDWFHGDPVMFTGAELAWPTAAPEVTAGAGAGAGAAAVADTRACPRQRER